MKKIRVIKKKDIPVHPNMNEVKQPVTMRCRARTSIITFIKRNGKVVGEVSCRSDYSVQPIKQRSSVMQEVQDV